MPRCIFTEQCPHTAGELLRICLFFEHILVLGGGIYLTMGLSIFCQGEGAFRMFSAKCGTYQGGGGGELLSMRYIAFTIAFACTFPSSQNELFYTY